MRTKKLKLKKSRVFYGNFNFSFCYMVKIRFILKIKCIFGISVKHKTSVTSIESLSKKNKTLKKIVEFLLKLKKQKMSFF